ncbi:MAG TPA: cation:proton antiporter, partial [Anaerolineales bacterium]|nr:cation:proton antiporter [Anaerolineales bacterium]
MHQESEVLTTIIAAVGFGLFAQVLAHRWSIPAIVLLLLSGILLGPHGFHLIEPEALGEGLEILVKLAVAVILFEGALNLRLQTLRHSALEVRNLVTIGVLISWAVTSF